MRCPKCGELVRILVRHIETSRHEVVEMPNGVLWARMEPVAGKVIQDKLICSACDNEWWPSRPVEYVTEEDIIKRITKSGTLLDIASRL